MTKKIKIKVFDALKFNNYNFCRKNYENNSNFQGFGNGVSSCLVNRGNL